MYPLIEVLFLIICAVISGADDCEQIEEFSNNKISFLRKYFPFKKGIPTGATIKNILSILDTKVFQKAFVYWTKELAGKIKGVIALDGKTMRGSGESDGSYEAIHIVSAWASEQQLLLGQLKTNEKSNEITAIPELLNLLDIEGSIITIDAMGCQKEIAKMIVDKKADYVLAIKNNHPTLCDDVCTYFSELGDKKKISTLEKDHGRIEHRQYFLTEDIDSLIKEHPEWAGLKTIGMVISNRTIKDKTSEEKRFFISSLPNDIELFSSSVRAHWGVENKVHWVLDVVFRDDHTRTRKDNSAANLSIFKRLAMNLLRRETSKASFRKKRFRAALDESYLEKVLTCF